jgi:hypothetical protein
MPELEYLVLAEYVRQDAGMTHIMAAGIDTFWIPDHALPAAVPVGLVARLTFDSRDRVGADHNIGFVFENTDGPQLITLNQRIPTPAPARGVPEHWRTAANVIFRLALLFPAHGNYRLQVTVDDDPRMSRSLDVRAIPLAPAQG